MDVGEVFIQAAKYLARLRLHEVVVQGIPCRHFFPAQEQVGHGVQVVGQRQRLVDGFDAVLLCVGRGPEVHFPPHHMDLA